MQQPTSVSVNHHTSGFDWSARLRAASIHLGLSALVALLAGLLVFSLWYPYPYREVSGGRDLFRLVVSVDVVLGPLITFTVFNLKKPRAELRRDLLVVVLLQLAGLGYGLWTVQLARPVHLVFEYDRFRVVHLVDIPPELHARVPAGIELAPLRGPTLLALRPLRSENERVDLTLAAMDGVSLSARPQLWEPYAAATVQVLRAARPATELQRRFPQQAARIGEALRQSGRDAAQAAYLPLVSRREAWTVLLDARTAEVIGYLPLDSF